LKWHGVLCALVIELHGDAALFPSTSNSKQIYFNKKTGARFVGKSSSANERISLINSVFVQELAVTSQLPVPSFGEFPIHCLALLAHRGGKFDSHNYSKPIGDWLQSTGIIDDDTHAEILCLKKTDYPQGRLTNIAEYRERIAKCSQLYNLRRIQEQVTGSLNNTSSTTLVVQLRSNISRLTDQYIHELTKTAFGIRLIG
jgi:hypothetical protein